MPFSSSLINKKTDLPSLSLSLSCHLLHSCPSTVVSKKMHLKYFLYYTLLKIIRTRNGLELTRGGGDDDYVESTCPIFRAFVVISSPLRPVCVFSRNNNNIYSISISESDGRQQQQKPGPCPSERCFSPLKTRPLLTHLHLLLQLPPLLSAASF